MKRILLIHKLSVLASCCSVVWLTGCASTTIFKADFEADALGRPPALSPAGAPDGDAIDLSDPVIHGVAYVTNWPLRSEKAMHVFGAPMAITNIVRCLSIPVTADRNRKLVATWDGFWIGPFPAHSRTMVILTGNGNPLAVFNLEGGNITERLLDAAGHAAVRTLAPLIGNREHGFVVSIDLTTGVVSTTFLQRPTGTVSLSGTYADFTPAAASATRFELSFLIEQTYPDAPISYLVNNAIMATADR